jgi:hypothetical protein
MQQHAVGSRRWLGAKGRAITGAQWLHRPGAWAPSPRIPSACRESAVTRKPKLSGAQRRKLAKQRAADRLQLLGGDRPLRAELLPPVRIEDLESVRSYRHEMNRLYALMRGGDLLTENGTRLTYVLREAANLARIEEELRLAAAIRDQLMELNAGARALELLPPSPQTPAADTAPISPLVVEGLP